MDEVEKMPGQGGEAEKPEIYSLKKGENGFAYHRREFLMTAAAGGAAIGMLGMGIEAVMPDRQEGQAEDWATEVDESLAVLLEVQALAMLIVPLAKGVEQAWKISNQGKVASPPATLYVSAEHAADLQQALAVPEIPPGQSVEVPVSLTAPAVPGEYRYRWQLRLGDGNAKNHEFILKVPEVVLAESAHPYANDLDQTWTINNPDAGAISSVIHFSRIEVEDGFDFIYVMDGSDSVVQTITGNYSSGLWSNKVNGAVVKVRLVTDYSITKWGFQVDGILSTFRLTYLPFLRKPQPTPTSYTVCTCNTVDLCICNLVCTCDSYCSCNTVCTCDTVCSCVGYCTCNTVHYWYPN